MPSFSVISGSGEIRSLVQSNMLQRMFHDALLPAFLFRMDVEAEMWAANVGDNKTFTGVGLIQPNLLPLPPGQDPTPKTYTAEQWTATMQQYADTIDSIMPQSYVALANLFLRNSKQIGIQAAQSLNRIVRDRAYDAGLSGNTMIDGTQTGTSIKVLQINGFTTARNPNLAAGSPVQFAPVSSVNPLNVTLYHAGSPVAGQVTGAVGRTYTINGVNYVTSTGPGTLTFALSQTTTDRDPLLSNDASSVIRAGGGLSTDTITAGSGFTLQLIRSAVSQMRTNNVHPHADGYYHSHLSPISESEIFGDPEWQRLNTSLPDWFAYKNLAIGQTEGTVFLRNNECPSLIANTVAQASTAYSQASAYTEADPFAGILQNTAGVNIQRPLFTGLGGMREYYADLSQLITEVGLNGKAGYAKLTNDGIDVYADRIQLLFRAPLNRIQDTLATTWKFLGDWPVRTDAATGNQQRYKRVLTVETA